MAGAVVPFPPQKACSGKCKGECGRAAPRLWVLAASEGKVSLFEQCADTLRALPVDGMGDVFPSLQALNHMLEESCKSERFDQLMLVGSASDTAWLLAALPEDASRRVVAQVEYPLLPGWFSAAAVGQLGSALTRVLHP